VTTQHLHALLLAERASVHGPTGHTLFYMVYGREAVLPIETRYPTWRTLEWKDVHTRGELITARVKQIRMRDESVQEAMLRKTRIRQAGKEYFDSTHQIRETSLNIEDLVLRHDTFTVGMGKSTESKLSW
jgi:hypothetical protein